MEVDFGLSVLNHVPQLTDFPHQPLETLESVLPSLTALNFPMKVSAQVAALDSG